LAVGQSSVITVNYDVEDPDGETVAQTVTITITGTNDGPVAVADSASVSENTFTSFNVVVPNDTDIDDGDVIRVISVADVDDGQPDASGSAAVAPGVPGTFSTDWGASITVSDNGLVTYDASSSAAAFNALGAGVTGVDTFTYTVEDTQGATATATVSVTITGVNDQVQAVADTITATENGAGLTGSITTNDSDVDVGDVLTVSGVVADTGSTVTAVSGGWRVDLSDGASVMVMANGNYTVTAPETLNVGTNPTGTFQYTLTDSKGSSATATVSVTVNGSNDAPIAVAAATAVTEDDTSPLGIDLLQGVTDIDVGAVLTTSAVAQTSGTSVTPVVTGNTLSFDASAFNGLAAGESEALTFGYIVTDENGASVAQTLTVTVNGVNDAPVAFDDTATVAENAVQNIDVTGNDTDADLTDDLEVVGVDITGTSGSVTVGADGDSVDYETGTAFDNVAKGATATDTFTYVVDDGNGGSDTGSVTIVVTGVNDAPVVAAALTAGYSEDDASASIDLLSGASDVDDGAVLNVTGYAVTSGDATGLTLAGNSLSVDPSAYDALAFGESEVIEISYTVEDEFSGAVAQTLTLTITGANDAPVAAAVTGNVLEDGPVVMVTADFVDVDANDTHTFSVDTTGTLGSVTDNGDGTFDYDPNGAFEGLLDGETATDTFDYTVTDGFGATSTETVTITITGQNDGPVAAAIAGAVDENGSAITITASFTDVDLGDGATVTIDDTGTIGAVTNTAGVFTYDPDGQFENLAEGITVTDAFTYTVEDTFGTTSTQTVTVTITGQNDGPAAVAVSAAADEDGPAVTITGVFTDVDSGDTSTVAVDLSGTVGSVTELGGATFEYDATGAFDALAAGESAIDTFAYTVEDGSGATSTETVTVTVTGQNDGPVAVADTITVDNTDGSASFDLVANDTDVDTSDTLSVQSIDAAGVLGTVTATATGVDYDPNGMFASLLAGETATETFTYIVEDGNGGSDQQTVTVTVNGTNDAPVAVDDAVTFAEDDGAVNFNPLVNDTDANVGDTLSIASVDDAGTTGLIPTALRSDSGIFFCRIS